MPKKVTVWSKSLNLIKLLSQ